MTDLTDKTKTPTANIGFATSGVDEVVQPFVLSINFVLVDRSQHLNPA